MSRAHLAPSTPTPLPLAEGEGKLAVRIAGGDLHKI